MRKPISLLLVSILFINLFGFYLAFVVKRADIRQEMLGQIKDTPRADCKLISFSKAGFQQIVWKETGKEFLFNGKMYDVAFIETLGNNVKIYVLDDDEETSLISGFVTVASQHSDNDGTNSPIKNLLQHFLQEFTTVSGGFYLFNSPLRQIMFSQNDSCLASYTAELQSPPPKAA